MKFWSCSNLPSAALCAGAFYLAAILASPLSFAQGNVLSVDPPQTLTIKAKSAVDQKLTVKIRDGYHVNSNKPADEYLIPLRLSWTGGPLTAGDIVYPKAQMEKYPFSADPLSVYTGGFEIVTHFTAPAGAAAGPATIAGKLRYQACNDRMCLPPKTVEFQLPVEVVK